MAEYVTKIRTSDGDLPVDYNSLANLPELNTMFSNPNLLINSDFRNPVNQRGETTRTTNDLEWTRAYFIDRWYAQHGLTVELADGYIIAYASDTTEEAYFCQTLEHVLSEDNYTTTVNVKSVTGTVKIHGQELVTGINTITAFVAEPSVEIKFMPGSSIELYWVKLECGSISTPLVPRTYGEELQLCKRYYQAYTDNDQFIVLTQTYTSTTATNGRFNLPVEMRIAPIVSVISLEIKEINEGEVVTLTEFSGNSISNNVVEITGTHSSKAVSQRYMYAKAKFDAEIY